MVRARVAACVAGIGLFVAALGAISGQQDPRDRAISSDRIAAPASVIIPCATTPFGNALPIFGDYEAMLLLWGSGGKYFDEYRPSQGAEAPPLQRVYRANLATNRTLRKAVNADISGDGRDEVVELLADGSDVQIAVYERTAGPTALPISTWLFSESAVAGSLSIVAGDLDGSKDRQKEIALSWTIGGAGADAGKVRVVVLQGSGIAHIVQAANVTAGNFVTSTTGLLFPRLVAGDFLAQGRDQLALAAYEPTTGKVSLDLLEFDNGTHAATVTTVLPSLGNAMRGAHYSSRTLDVAGAFYYDDNTHSDMQTSGGIPVIESLEVNGGDVVDTVADELVFHFMFVDPVQAKHVLAQRLLHFLTTRSVSNAITAISLNDNRFGFSTQFDSSIKVGSYPDPAPKFAAVAADVDAIANSEIVTAIAGHDGNNGPTLGPMVWAARKVYVRNSPAFNWQNLGESVIGFTSTAHGEITDYEWDFGDGSGISTDKNPRHTYASNGNYNVGIHTTDSRGSIVFLLLAISVTDAVDPAPQNSGYSPPWLYGIDPAPFFDYTTAPDYSYPTHAGDNTIVKVAVGDMNRDSLPEVVVAVNNDGGAVDTHVFKRQANGSFGRTTVHDTLDTGNTAIELLLSDFDGDSLNAVVSSVAGDCRTVTDKSVRSLTWMPPYFSVPQAGARRFVTYGSSSSTSTSAEERSESYFSNSFTVSVGLGYEVDAPVVGIKLSEGHIKAVIGGEYQTSKGELHGDESETSIDEARSLGNDAVSAEQEGLLYAEENTSNCFSYKLTTGAGPVPGSSMRSCNVNRAVPKIKSGPGAVNWNLLANEPKPVEVPVHWVPMQRDWASLALFHLPKAGSDPTTPIAFTGGHEASKATDGLFDTAAESSSAVKTPYLEVDLGFVREIQSVRVFPSADAGTGVAGKPIDFKNSVMELWGYRLYASVEPFDGDDLPTTDDFTTFVPEGVSTFVQPAGVEAVYRNWNVWTGDPNTGEMLRARYLRLQKPTPDLATAVIRIAEIQVFGDTHTEPQFYPQAVCDPTVGDGLFKALVFDDVNRQSKVIEIRGDMLWTGATDGSDTGVPGCSNDTTNSADSPKVVPQGPIWQGQAVGEDSEVSWNLSSDNTHTDATSTSTEWSAHVGAEFEAGLGSGVLILVGGSYEATRGTTKENQSSTSMGTGFQVGGEIGAFEHSIYVAKGCTYFPRPYAFQATNYSDSGWRQEMYVTDYVVRQPNTPGTWQRGSVPATCSDNSNDDLIFADVFGFGD